MSFGHHYQELTGELTVIEPSVECPIGDCGQPVVAQVPVPILQTATQLLKKNYMVAICPKKTNKNKANKMYTESTQHNLKYLSKCGRMEDGGDEEQSQAPLSC